MGYYINQVDQTKEEFLVNNGKEIEPQDLENFDFMSGRSPVLPVCWVDNGTHTAAGIAVDRMELVRFMRLDERPRVWFLVNRELLQPFLPKTFGGAL